MTSRFAPSGRSGSAVKRGWSAGQPARRSPGGCGPRSRVRCASTASTRAAYRSAALSPWVVINTFPPYSTSRQREDFRLLAVAVWVPEKFDLVKQRNDLLLVWRVVK